MKNYQSHVAVVFQYNLLPLYFVKSWVFYFMHLKTSLWEGSRDLTRLQRVLWHREDEEACLICTEHHPPSQSRCQPPLQMSSPHCCVLCEAPFLGGLATCCHLLGLACTAAWWLWWDACGPPPIPSGPCEVYMKIHTPNLLEDPGCCSCTPTPLPGSLSPHAMDVWCCLTHDEDPGAGAQNWVLELEAGASAVCIRPNENVNTNCSLNWYTGTCDNSQKLKRECGKFFSLPLSCKLYQLLIPSRSQAHPAMFLL